MNCLYWDVNSEDEIDLYTLRKYNQIPTPISNRDPFPTESVIPIQMDTELILDYIDELYDTLIPVFKTEYTNQELRSKKKIIKGRRDGYFFLNGIKTLLNTLDMVD